MVSSDEIIYQDEYVLLTSGKIRVGSLFLERRQVRFADVVRQDYPMRRNVLLGWGMVYFAVLAGFPGLGRMGVFPDPVPR